MTNHYHLLVETPEANLSQAIQWINVSYAVYLSRKLTRLSGNELGRYFGNITGAAITMRCKTVAEQIQKDRKLNRRINRLEHPAMAHHPMSECK